MPSACEGIPSGCYKIQGRHRQMSSFPSHFRRKYITGEAYITRRKAYITDLHSKSISLRDAHIPMRITLRGKVFSAGPVAVILIVVTIGGGELLRGEGDTAEYLAVEAVRRLLGTQSARKCIHIFLFCPRLHSGVHWSAGCRIRHRCLQRFLPDIPRHCSCSW